MSGNPYIPPSKRGTCADCGALMWRGRTSLPQGLARCLACRRASNPPRPPAVTVQAACRVCGDLFEHLSSKRRIYCTPACRDRVRRVAIQRPDEDAKEASRIREKARRAKRGNVYGAGWVKLRAQVLAEESSCHLCGFDIDAELRWPDPWSGTADHVIPISMGGAPLDRDNVRAAHLRCNLSKGAKHERAAS